MFLINLWKNAQCFSQWAVAIEKMENGGETKFVTKYRDAERLAANVTHLSLEMIRTEFPLV